MKNFVSLLLVCIVTFSLPLAAGTLPAWITYQGEVAKDGAPVDGLADFRFRLYETATGGDALIGGSANSAELMVYDGVFTTNLLFDQILFDGRDLWMEIDVRYPCCTGAYNTLTPRQPIRPTPYAWHAINGGNSFEPVWYKNGNNAWFTGGNVGIGTTFPSADLHLNSISGGVELKMESGPSEPAGLFQSESSVFSIRNAGVDRISITSNGLVGVGTTAPVRALHVHNNTEPVIRLSGNGNNPSNAGRIEFAEAADQPDANFQIQYDGSNAANNRLLFRTFGNSGLNDRIALMRESGFMGIGTVDPLNLLDVSGPGSTAGSREFSTRLGEITEYPWVVARFKQTTSDMPSAISVDSLPGQNSMLALAHDSLARFSLQSVGSPDTGINAELQLWAHHANGNYPVWSLRVRPGFNDAEILQSASLNPVGSNSFTLGNSGNRWKEIWSNNALNTSDRRAKQDIEPIEGGLDKVMQLKPVSYRWKNQPDEDKGLSLIAQDVLKVVPEVVYVPDDPDEMMAMKYNELIPLLVGAIQEQQAQIAEQAALIRALTARLEPELVQSSPSL